ncbi:hypothetical protein E4U55_005476 [Claviceps digitariae]|nr:hypothetical protein E4U55_005476 [Claviceps digitariae]
MQLSNSAALAVVAIFAGQALGECYTPDPDQMVRENFDRCIPKPFGTYNFWDCSQQKLFVAGKADPKSNFYQIQTLDVNTIVGLTCKIGTETVELYCDAYSKGSITINCPNNLIDAATVTYHRFVAGGPEIQPALPPPRMPNP